MSNDWSLSLKLGAQNREFVNKVTESSLTVKRFSDKTKAEFDRLKSHFNSTSGRILQIAGGWSTAKLLADSAKLDKSLTKVRQTAGATVAQQAAMRTQLMQMAIKTGQEVESLQTGFDGLIASGMTWGEAAETIMGIAVAMAVTESQATTLSSALTVAGSAFQFDLSKPGLALEVLDKMTVAGRLGNAELEGLSDIFSRVAVNAKFAGMSFEQTLAFVESLSNVTREIGPLGTLVESTLRVFTNSSYMKKAQSKTGVKFFDVNGNRRDAIVILNDLKTKYGKLQTDLQRSKFIANAFEGADQTTLQGIRTLLSGDYLESVSKIEKEIMNASGTLQRDLPTSLMNAGVQAARLKNTLREAADDFCKPINETIAKMIKFTIDKDENGKGLGLGGKEIVGGGIAALVALYAGKRMLPGIAGKLSGKLFGTASGVVEGKVLEKAAGVTPVFIVNWPSGGFGGSGFSGGKFEEFKNINGGTAGASSFLRLATSNPVALAALGLTLGAGALLIHDLGKPRAETFSQKKSRELEAFKKSGDWQKVVNIYNADSDRSNVNVAPKVENIINIDLEREQVRSRSNVPVSNSLKFNRHLAFFDVNKDW